MRRGIAVACLGCFGAFAWISLHAADLAPPDEYEGKPIQGVRFEPPSQPVTRADLSRLMLPFANGKPLHLAEVRSAIQRLFNTGLYSNIEVEAEPAPGGVVVVIRTQEQWFVGPVEVRGRVRYPPNQGQLANSAQLSLGMPFSEDDLEAATKRIVDLLQRNGLYRSRVHPRIERDVEHQQVSLIFTVNSGRRARLTLPVVTGDTRLPPAELAHSAGYKGWFGWKSATAANTQSGVRNIRRRFEKDQRLTADVRLERRDYLAATNQVRPLIHADGGPKVKITSESGKISKGDLEKYVPVFQAQSVNRDLLVRGAGNLRDYLQNQGYFDVQVDFQTANPGPDLETITYVVGLGERQKLARVDITGNRYFRTRDIRDRIFLHSAGFVRFRHGRYAEGFVSRDVATIQALYRDNGFQDAKVTVTTIPNYLGRKGYVAATIAIDEGPQYKVAALNVEGINRPDRAQILAKLASVPGQPFSVANVSLDRDYILNVYQSAGYLDARFDWHATDGPGPNQKTLYYTVTEGMPRFVREVLVTGLRTTRRSLVDPTITLKPGQPISWEQMGLIQRRLYNLGVFDNVDMAVQNPDGDTENKYVLFHVTEGHRYQMAVGLGAELAQIGGSQTSLSNPGGQTGFSPVVSFDLSRLNLWGLGHSLNFRSSYSTLDQQVSLNYLAPRFRNVTGQNLSFTVLYDNERDVRTFTARRIEGNAQISERLSKATRLLFRYSWRDVQVDQNTLKINPLLIPLLSQPARIGIFSSTLIQDRRDNPADAHRGIYNTIDLGLADRYFGGNKNFLRFLAHNSFYQPITRDVVLASNTQFGMILPFGVPQGETGFDYVPLPERFFGGGTNSMRGFPDNQAGPRDPITGFPLGGNALFFHQTEVRFPLLGDNIGGVFFHDFGNIFANLRDISFRVRQRNLTDFGYMVHAVGFGVRYKTPIGPVRLDLAYSINPPTFNGLVGTVNQLLFGGATPTITSISHFQFFFSIGQAF